MSDGVVIDIFFAERIIALRVDLLQNDDVILLCHGYFARHHMHYAVNERCI